MLKFADVDAFIRTTSAALTVGLTAAERADAVMAADVLASSAARSQLAAAARRVLQDRAWVPLPKIADEVRVVDDIEHVSRLVDELAGLVIGAGDTAQVNPPLADDLRRLRDAGARRFRAIQDGCVYAASGAGCTAVFFDVMDHAVGAGTDVGVVTGQIAGALLQTTRHAAVAA